MPQHEVGYREWDGKKTAQVARWWIIAESGFHLAIKSSWVKRLLFVAWLPVLYWSSVFFVVENTLLATSSPEMGEIAKSLLEDLNDETIDPESVRQKAKEAGLDLRQLIQQRAAANRFRSGQIGGLPVPKRIAEAIESGDVVEQRHVAWSWLLMVFFRYPQATMIIFLLGFISPGLISRDFRSRAFLIYFSKPIGRLEYIFGKLVIPSVFLLLVTTIPALCLFALGLSLSPDISVIGQTWDVPLRILFASVVLIVPTASLSLMLSSLTQESRFASFAWFAVWILGHGAWFAVWVGQAIRLDQDPFEIASDPTVLRWSFLSLYNNLGNVQSWIFGLSDFQSAVPGIIVLTALTVVSLLVLFRRVSAPIRV